MMSHHERECCRAIECCVRVMSLSGEKRSQKLKAHVIGIVQLDTSVWHGNYRILFWEDLFTRNIACDDLYSGGDFLSDIAGSM